MNFSPKIQARLTTVGNSSMQIRRRNNFSIRILSHLKRRNKCYTGKSLTPPPPPPGDATERAVQRMEQMVGIVTVLMVALLAPSARATVFDTGAGKVYRLEMEQDVTLERPKTNYNYLEYLIVAKHPEYPNKRSLVQFENLPSSCPPSKIQSAKMYLYYVYAHKASKHTITQSPFIPRCLQLYLVKKSWKEAKATSIKRDSSNNWSTLYLGLDGIDAEVFPEPDTVMIFPRRPRNDFVEFDVTNAVKRWKYGLPNHGLLIRATNELAVGRDIRFASNAMSDSSKHAYILVLCSY